ncbi:hypothetical protein FBU31_002679, partial [Coemansia sp. 'formosensis']
VVSRVAVRGFSVSAASKKGTFPTMRVLAHTRNKSPHTGLIHTLYIDAVDFLQDLYLKEIRGYKADPKASKADVTTKEFVAPKAAQAPKSDVDLEADIKAYEKNGVISQ